MKQTVTSISECILAIEEVIATTEELLLPKRLYYRGQANENYDLLPSLARKLEGCHNLEDGFERRIVEFVEEKFPEAFETIHTPIDRLAFLQHLGAPTRLLDITASPLVALYFAVTGKETEEKYDGEVLVFCTADRDSERSPMLMAIADSYRMIRGSIDYLDLFYNRVKTQDYFLEQKDLVDNWINDMGGGAQWVYDCCMEPLFVHSFHHSLRQRVQQSSFILFSNEIDSSLEHPAFIENIKPLSKENPVIAARFIIPSASKKKIATELAHIGITREMLFADSIDVACEESGKYALAHSFSNRFV